MNEENEKTTETEVKPANLTNEEPYQTKLPLFSFSLFFNCFIYKKG